MRSHLPLRLLLVLSACLGVALPLRAAEESTDRIIVKWRPVAGQWVDDAAEAHALRTRSGRAVRLARSVGAGMSLLRLDRPVGGAELDSTLAALRHDPRVQLAEPDRRVHIHAYTPNDPLYAQQWYLGDTEIAAIRANAAWDVTRGGDAPATSPVVVAVIDTGVRFDHPDLAKAESGGKLLPGYDFVSSDLWNNQQVFATANDGDGWDNDPSDPGDFISAEDLASGPFAGKKCGAGDSDTAASHSSWHGTRVSGLIAAGTDNGAGIAGAGFNVRVLPVRALGKCGGYDSDVIASMYWAAGIPIPAALMLVTPPANPHPAQVVNLSLGSVGPCTAQYAEAVRTLTERGVLVVVSAGNEGKAVDSPANCPGAVAVAGLRHIGTKVGYSNLGPEVTLAAPAGNCVNDSGDCLYQLTTTTNAGMREPGAYSYTTPQNENIGTSFSTPLVAATAGLMKAVNPALTPAMLIARLRASARPFPTTSTTLPAPPVCSSPATTALQDGECICTTALCGAGMLDTAAAVTQALRPTAVARVEGVVGPARQLTLDGTASGAAAGRSLVSHAWTVVSTAGGAKAPVISSAAQASASVPSPSLGSYTLRLTIADNQGATDSAEVTVIAANGGGTTTGTNPPPTTGGSGGGGSTGLASLLLLGTLLFTQRRRIFT